MKKDMNWFREQLCLAKEEIRNSNLSPNEKYSRLLGLSFATGLSKEVDLDDITKENKLKSEDEPNKELAFNMWVYVAVGDDYVEDEVHGELLAALENKGYSGEVYEIREQEL